MTFEAWDEALTLNHAIIDHDHQDLFESIQRLRAALSAGQSAEPTGGRQERVAAAIAGGASNIQLNIIGERGYGLPRDLRAPR